MSVGLPRGRKWSVDTTRWPILVVTQHAPQLTDQERKEALDATDRAVDTGGGLYAVIHDSRFAEALSPKQRAMIADFGRRNEQRTRERCVGTAFVFDSVVMRAALTAISWLKPQVVEIKVFATLDEAHGWARERLDERHVRDHYHAG
jgi:hypothetical protein